jgi:hypothetical protein
MLFVAFIINREEKKYYILFLIHIKIINLQIVKSYLCMQYTLTKLDAVPI